VAIWQETDDAGHVDLVQRYFEVGGIWTALVVRVHRPPWGDPLYGVIGRRAKRA
jgi:hypothetical protein